MAVEAPAAVDGLTVVHRMMACISVSVADRALHMAERRDHENARSELHDKAAEAALAGNPKRARHYEEWADRV